MIIGFVVFAIIVNNINVPGVTDAPAYARNMLYASVSHHFAGVQNHLYRSDPPPPPPIFRN